MEADRPKEPRQSEQWTWRVLQMSREAEEKRKRMKELGQTIEARKLDDEINHLEREIVNFVRNAALAPKEPTAPTCPSCGLAMTIPRCANPKCHKRFPTIKHKSEREPTAPTEEKHDND